MINRLRTWWQLRTGEEDTPFDGDMPAWVCSMMVHLVAMLILGFWYVDTSEPKPFLVVELPRVDEAVEDIPVDPLPKELKVSDEQKPDIGADAPVDGGENADP